MKLMIVESPNKIKKIRAILNAAGAGWEVAASVGHIRDLPVKELGIAMPAYAPEYELTERGRDVLKRLKPLAARADQVYLATDPDREGEAIAWHLKEALRLRSYQRIAFDAITPAVVARALERPRRIDDHLVHAQEARRVLDRLVGYQVSPVLSRQTGRRGLSAGRVQSPAVRLVVDREREIEAFTETKHFGAEVTFDANAWRAQWETAPFLPKGEKYLMDQPLADRAAQCRAFQVTSSDNRRTAQPPPPPFTTSTLLQAASVTLGLKPDVTAGIAQRLFEAGLITYHRTDSQNLSAEALKDVRAFAVQRGLPLPAAARHFKARGGAQEAHEAIRPTSWPSETAGDDRLEQSVYRLIWTRAVASQLADAEYSVNTLRLLALGEAGLPPGFTPSEAESKRFTFKAVGRTLIAPGWKTLTARDDAEEDEPARPGDDSENCGKVPLLPVATEPLAETGRVLYKQTRPPARYTQASLIKKLESIGIGRPSTYPAILKNVLTRGYLAEAAKFLTPTELGCLVVDTLEPRFRFLDYAFTRDLEQQLDDIAEGKAQYRDVVAAADAQLQSELAKLGGAATPRPSFTAAPAAAPPSRQHLPPRPGPGNSTPRSALARSSGARQPASAPVPGTAVRAPRRRAAAKRSATVTDIVAPAGKRNSHGAEPSSSAERSRARSTGAGAVPAPGAAAPPSLLDQAPPAATPTYNCPLCRQGTLRLSRDEKFYGCTRYNAPNSPCRFTINTILASRRLKPSDLAALSAHGRTGKLSGFLSKTGRPFEAALVLTEAGRIEFSFDPR